MKFAVLGSDPNVAQLVAAARRAGHNLISFEDSPKDAPRPGQSSVEHTTPEWELLLAAGYVDGVLVGREPASNDLRAEQISRLVKESVPLLIVHPVFDTVLPYYEIDMVRRETGAIVQHFNPLTTYPEIAKLADWVEHGHPSIGKIHQVTCERSVASAARADILGHLARDVELLAGVVGSIRRVSAIGPALLDTSFASLQVQLTATNVSSARWSVGSTAAAAGLELTLRGEHGAAVLRQWPASNAATSVEWQLTTTVDRNTSESPTLKVDAAGSAISRFATSVADKNAASRSATSTWDAATRDMEVIDAVELSLQKGRTIEVFQQQLTEQMAFRGVMSALGCGLLLVSFFAVVAIAFLGGAEGMLQDKILPAWPIMLVAVLAVFLALQLVPFLLRRSPKDARASASPDRDPAD